MDEVILFPKGTKGELLVRLSSLKPRPNLGKRREGSVILELDQAVSLLGNTRPVGIFRWASRRPTG